MYCYFNNGLSMRTVDDDYTVSSEEVLFDHEATTAELTSAFSGYAAAVKTQKITALNATYEDKFTELALKYSKAACSDGTNVATKQATIITQYSTEISNKTTERSAILNG